MLAFATHNFRNLFDNSQRPHNGVWCLVDVGRKPSLYCEIIVHTVVWYGVTTDPSRSGRNAAESFADTNRFREHVRVKHADEVSWSYDGGWKSKEQILDR